MREVNRREATVGLVLALTVMISGVLAVHRLTRGAELPMARLVEKPGRSWERIGPEIDIQRQGPLGYGRKVSVAELKEVLAFAVPVPPEDELTGKRTGIWIGGLPNDAEAESATHVGMVWARNTRFYFGPTDETDAEAVRAWGKMIATEPGGWVLTSVRGHPALGRERSYSGDTASLSWREAGLSLQLVSPVHTLEQLRDLAERIRFEG